MTVLVTAVGTINGATVVDELRKYNEDSIKIIGANSTPKEYVVTSKYVDEFYMFPSAVESPDSYLKFVIEFCDEHCVTHLFCFIDEEVELFARNRNLFERHNVTLCLADYKTILTCHFKDRFCEWIENNMPEIAIKRYVNGRVNKGDLPLFVKPIEGRASIGCRPIETESELNAFFQETNYGKGYVVQEKQEGDIIGVDIVRNKEYGQVLIIQKKELMRNGNGCGVVVEIVDYPKIKEICLELAEKLDLNGLVNVEFFITPNGPKIIEINPRLPAGTSYSCLAGGNTVMNTLLIAEGKACQYDNIKVGKIYARRYETYEM